MTAASIASRQSLEAKFRLLNPTFLTRFLAWLQRRGILERDCVANGMKPK